MNENTLEKLSSLLDEYNSIGKEISRITNRPATIGHTGEFIAGIIFDIKLEESASHKATDGFFQSGPLDGKSVNIKWYGKQEALLDVLTSDQPDFYLVMTGPKTNQMSSKGAIRPWVIDHVYLFDAHRLISELKARGVKIGIATSVIKQQWRDAQIYPTQNNKIYRVTSEQRNLLKSFGS